MPVSSLACRGARRPRGRAPRKRGTPPKRGHVDLLEAALEEVEVVGRHERDHAEDLLPLVEIEIRERARAEADAGVEGPRELERVDAGADVLLRPLAAQAGLRRVRERFGPPRRLGLLIRAVLAHLLLEAREALAVGFVGLLQRLLLGFPLLLDHGCPRLRGGHCSTRFQSAAPSVSLPLRRWVSPRKRGSVLR